MARIINVCIDNKKFLENYDNIPISDINNIINHSVDFIKFDYLQFFEYKIAQEVFGILINKLKLNGLLIIAISDFKNVARLYTDSVISDNKFLEKIYNCKSIWSTELLSDVINRNYQDIQLTKMQYDNENSLMYLTIERKSL